MEEKKKYILDSVGKLYMKYGIKSVTMDVVANELGISKKTLYQYFKDKEDLIRQVITYFSEKPDLHLSCGEEKAENAISQLFAIRKRMITILIHFNNNLEFDLKKLYPDLYKMIHVIKRKRIYEDTIRNLKIGISEGLYRKNLDVDFIARLHVGRLLYTFNPDSEIFKENETFSVDIFDKALDYHLHAICTEKGLNYYIKQLNIIQNEKNN